jgi:hypothetical protein
VTSSSADRGILFSLSPPSPHRFVTQLRFVSPISHLSDILNVKIYALENLDAPIEILMEEVAVTLERIRTRREGRNALLPIYSLPAEILIRVFKILQIMVSTKKKDRMTIVPFVCTNARWLYVTYVCQYFREVALQDGSLWAAIDLKWHPELVSLCTERAHGHPIGIYAELRSIHKRNMARFGRIVLTAQNLELWDTHRAHSVMVKLKPYYIPQLRGLAYTPSADYVFGLSFLERDCQMLTTLKIYDATLHSSNIYSFPELLLLRTLSLVKIRIIDNVQTLCHILHKTPNIETLIMDTVTIFGQDVDSIEDTYREFQMPGPVSLPALREAHIESHVIVVWICLRVLPEPLQRLDVELLNDETLTHKRIQNRYITYYNDVFERVIDFWKRKTGQSNVFGQFHHIYHASTQDKSKTSYVQFGPAPGAFSTPTISFRTPVNIKYMFSLWSRVSTLHLHQQGATKILYLDDVVSLSGLRLVVVDISDPDTRDMRNLCSWILDQALLGGPPIDVEFPADCSQAWIEFCEEMKDETPRVRMFYGTGQTARPNRGYYVVQ